jgi:Zn-dependent metalloprotease
MVEKIVEASGSRHSLFEGSIHTRFNDELFRKKRALLTEMNEKQMKEVLTISGKLMQSVSAAKKGARKKTAAAPKPVRKIYDAKNSEDQRSLPGKLVRKEGQKPVKDKDVNNIYDHCGHTWQLYYEKFGRNSIDGKGMTLINTVHFGKNFGNAFWEGSQMVYGDGDNVFKSFTIDIDITGHELTHGVVQYEANLAYENQSGAINESMADVFGSMVKQFALKQTAQNADWLIGAKIMKGRGYSLRSMKAPGSAYQNHPVLGDDPQPAHMNNYKNLPNTRQGDYGGVHINSGIPNHAFYLAAMNLGGNAWDKAGKIWYETLCDATLMNANSLFADLRNGTVTSAEKLYGVMSNEAAVVKKAWADVGL